MRTSLERTDQDRRPAHRLRLPCARQIFRLRDLRLAYFGVGSTPVRAHHAEPALADGDIDAAVRALAQDLNPPDDVQASGVVKTHLAGVLLRRVARQLDRALS